MRRKIIQNRIFYRFFLMILVIGMLMSGNKPGTVIAQSSCSNAVELADVPLELKSRAAPGLINLVLDNTRSMYWTIMTSKGDGTFDPDEDGNSYQFIFPDHTFGGDLLPYSYRNYWKTQWSGYNTMYYNPSVNYLPWPRWSRFAEGTPANENADINTPRMHPMESDNTINLNEAFYTVGGAVDSGQTIGNSDAAFNQPDNWILANGTEGVISHGSDSYHYSSTTGATATWAFNGLSSKQRFDVYAFIPYFDIIEELEHVKGVAKYVVTGQQSLSTTDNQWEYAGWMNLARKLRPKNDGTLNITLEVISGKISADAVKIVFAGEDLEEGDPPGITIINAHYYVKGNNGHIYLINLDSQFTYYRFEDQNENNRVDMGELILADSAEISGAGIDEMRGYRTYDQERQNFANWYQFYRKRSFTGIAAVARFIDDLSGAYFRLSGFPPASFRSDVLPIRVMVDGQYYDRSDEVLEELYYLRSPQAVGNHTLHKALEDVGDFFDYASPGSQHGIDNYAISDNRTPFFKAEYGGECQQAFAILMTGGYWRIPNNQDKTLADIAKYYWEKDLVESLADKVPQSSMDEATWQHLVTYGISFGVKGSIDPFGPENWPYCNLAGQFQCPDWPTPLSEESSTIDDLWHATVEGRGLFINASNPEELVQALKDILIDIERRLGSASAISTNSVQRQVGTHLYQGIYHSGFWSGDLRAIPLNVEDGSLVYDGGWSAHDELENRMWWDRNIFTFNGTNGIPFEYDYLSDFQKSQLHPDYANNTTMVKDIIDYLSGDRSLEWKNGGIFRDRNSKLGDIVHSEPFYHKEVVYVGANDGMLHAFDANTGEEIFAYIPNLVFGHLAELSYPTYEHRYYVNNTPYAKNIGGDTSLLVGGLSKGGKGYFCLDISNPMSFGAGNVKWEYSAVAENDPDLGYSYSRAYIVKTKAAGWVVVFGNGYNSVNGEAVLYVLSAADGSLIKKIHTGVFGCNGIVANAAIIDPNFDGNADYVYVGDLKGNMWKFDISGDSVNDWGVAFMSGTEPMPLFTAKNADGQFQTITTAADIMHHCTLDKLGYLVVFGTGQYVNEADFDTMDTQTLYGVTDWQPAWDYLGEASSEKFLGEFTTDRQLSNVGGLTLLQQEGDFITYQGEDYFVMSSNEIDYWHYSNENGSHLGWYLDLPELGERVIRDPMIRGVSGGVLIFIGSTPVQTPCQSGGSTALYQIDACSGGATKLPQFDTDESGKVDSGDFIVGEDGKIYTQSAIFYDKMLYKPVDIKDRLYLSDDATNIHDVVVPNIVGGMLYWRETDIRR